MTGKFADVGKEAKDVFKNHEINGRRITVQAKTQEGVIFTKEIKQDSKKGLIGKVAAKYKHANGFHLDKVEVDSSHTFSAKCSLNGAVKNVDAKFTLDFVMTDLQKDGAGEKSVLGVEYKAGPTTTIFQVDPISSTAAGNILFGYKNFSVGFSGEGGMQNSSKTFGATAYGACLGYAGADYTMAACYSKAAQHTADLSIIHKASPTVTFASICSYDLAKTDEPMNAVSIKMGGQYDLDRATSFRGMLDQKGNMCLSYVQMMRPNVKLTSTAQLNMDFMNSTGSTTMKYGMGLDLGDF